MSSPPRRSESKAATKPRFPGPQPWLIAWGTLAFGCSATPSPGTPAQHVNIPIVESDGPRSTYIVRVVPPSPEAPRETVRAFFNALTHGSPTDLRQTLADEALTFRPNHDPSSAVVAWHKRLDTLDYSTQSWADVLSIQVFDRASAQQLDQVRNFHLLPTSDEWLAVVDLPKSHVPPLWGEQMQLILRQRDDGLRITKIWENFAP